MGRRLVSNAIYKSMRYGTLLLPRREWNGNNLKRFGKHDCKNGCAPEWVSNLQRGQRFANIGSLLLWSLTTTESKSKELYPTSIRKQGAQSDSKTFDTNALVCVPTIYSIILYSIWCIETHILVTTIYIVRFYSGRHVALFTIVWMIGNCVVAILATWRIDEIVTAFILLLVQTNARWLLWYHPCLQYAFVLTPCREFQGLEKRLLGIYLYCFAGAGVVLVSGYGVIHEYCFPLLHLCCTTLFLCIK